MRVRRSRLQALTLLVGSVLLLWAEPGHAQVPKILSLEPPSGSERSLVVVKGSGLASAVVIWDAGLASEQKLLPTVQGATMFSVPPKSPSGSHPLAIESPAGRSATIPFVVTGAAPNAVPRLDGVTLASTKFDQAGNVQVVLYVQGANLDVGAKVRIDGVETPSSAHKAIYANLFGADPKALGYPIRHYLSRMVTPISRPIGSNVAVKVINEAGEESQTLSYKLPTDPKTFSSAGDGISDDAKLNGYDNGHGKIDLKALGADPFQKIVFVQLDIMQGSQGPIATSGDSMGTFDKAREMFTNAPILNPYGPNGIALVIDATGTVPSTNYLEWVDDDDPSAGVGSFWKLKSTHFDPRRQGLYHYAIWGRARLDGASGYSNADFVGTKVGDSFMITISEFSAAFQTVQSQAETFVHELGHDLGQKHGGVNHSKFKPNYWSDMSYAWQLRSSQGDWMRQEYPTCTQIYYATPGATEPNGKIPAHRLIRLDYSEGMARTLKNDKLTVDKKLGVCGQPIVWKTVVDGKPVNMIDVDAPLGDPVEDLANWPNLLFDGPRLGGSHDP